MTFPHSLIRLVPIVLLALPIAAPGAVAVTPAERCAMLELDAAARVLLAEVGCHARAVQQSTPVRPRCIADVERALAAALTRAQERGGCAFADDPGDIDEIVDHAISQLLDALESSKCGAAKLRAAARLGARELACRRRAIRLHAAVDAKCLNDAADRFAAAFANAERRNACTRVGDAAVVAPLVDAFAAATASRILDGPVAHDPKPGNLAAAVVGTQVQLTWTAPDPESSSTHVRVVRRLNAPPVDAADPAATVVFFGTATSANEPLTALLPSTAETPRVYHYAAFGCTAAAVCESTGSRATLTPTLVEVLRAGGYVLHWRHAAATVCQDRTDLGTAATTSSPDWWKSCDAQCPPGGMATARQMDATGVTQATTIGQALDALAIPIGRVLTSEFCRNVTTAVLMDFGPAIEQRQDITFFVYDEANRCNASYALLATAPNAGTNTAVIGHAGFTCSILDALAWGEAAIFKPDGGGGSTFVTRVLADAWPLP